MSSKRRRSRGREEVENAAPQVAGGGENKAANAVAMKVNPLKTFSFNRAFAEFPEKLVVVPAAGNKDRKLWEEQLLDDAQDNCRRRVLRLFLTKGAKGDAVKKADVLKILKDVDPTYSSVANSVLKEVKTELKNTFGYNVTTRADPRQKNEGEFIVFNSLRSPQLQDILADSASEQQSAWMGFVFVVLQIVNASAGKCIDDASLMAKVRELDERFPDTVSKGSSSSRAPVPELGADFPSLMKRMVNERYVVVKTEGGSASSSAAANRDEAKRSYTFGPRFFAELGRRQLLTSYYAALGQVVDMNMLDEAATAEEEQNALVDEEEEPENGEGNGGDNPDEADELPPAPAAEKKKKRRKS